MEPFAVAAARQLAATRPIGRLLGVHFRFMIHQNDAARRVLINPGGLVDRILGTGRPGAIAGIVNARADWTFAMAGLEADLTKRGFLGANGPNLEYPYAE